MLSVSEASERLISHFRPLPAERVDLRAAHGRVLAESIASPSNVPAHPTSMVDGYALRASDWHEGKALFREGESKAGSTAKSIRRGTAMRIFTGAPLPLDADSVVMQEDVDATNSQVSLRARPSPGKYLRGVGSDLIAGEEVLPEGTLLRAGEVALLASIDRSRVLVHRKPRVAILSNGDELREIGAAAEGTIVDANSYLLEHLVREAGAVPTLLPNARDSKEELVRILQGAQGFDLILSSGGVSVGEYDFVHAALEALNVPRDFWKVSMKPGKPFLFAQKDGFRFLGLPGNPVSAFVTFEVLVRPCLLRLQGRPCLQRPMLDVQLSRAVEREPGRTEYARVRLLHHEAGLMAELHPRQNSSSLASLVSLDALAIFPQDVASLPRGAELKALDLRSANG